LGLLPFQTFSQENIIAVNLSISIDSDLSSLEDLIISKVRKNIRSLDGVVIDEENPDFTITVMIISSNLELFIAHIEVTSPITTESIARSIAMIIANEEERSVSQEETKELTNMITSSTIGKGIDFHNNIFKKQAHYSWLSLLYTDSSLNSLLDRIVASFDVEICEEFRGNN